MRLNQKLQYGLSCLFELSLHAGEYVDAKSIAATRGIPPAYAQKILQRLCQSGFVHAQKGRGYTLSRLLKDMNVHEVLMVLNVEKSLGGATGLIRRHLNQALTELKLDKLVLPS